MPQQIPTTEEIKERIIAAIEAKINQNTPLSDKAFTRVLATVLAGLFTLGYKFGLWVRNQIFPQTADGPALINLGERLGVFFKAEGQALLETEETGTNGTLIKAGTQYVSPNQIVYLNQSDATIAGGVATLNLQSTSGGANANLSNGATLNIVQSIPGVTGVATVISTLISGVDAETLEDYRARVLERSQRRPQGGSVNDFLIWAKLTPGITRAFVTRPVPGAVDVYPLSGDEAGTRIPSPALLAEVAATIEDPALKPFVVTLRTLAMTELIFDVFIISLQPPGVDIETRITTNLIDFFLGRQPNQFINELDPRSVISEELVTAVMVASGAVAGDVTLELGGNPIDIFTLDINELALLGSITFL